MLEVSFEICECPPGQALRRSGLERLAHSKLLIIYQPNTRRLTVGLSELAV